MIILPAIDLKDGMCVRLFQGDYATAEQVAEDPVQTAQSFEADGARWMHIVDLDGAKARRPVNDGTIFSIRDNTSIHMEVGGGIRDMGTVEYYLSRGVSRVILGSAALQSPDFVREAVKKYGKKIAVGIDALNGKVAAEGWTAQSEVDYLEMAKHMESIGVRYLIVTDISKDGTMSGPNLVMLDKINRTVGCSIIASGGVSSIKDIVDLNALGLYGAIAGKSIYTKALDLRSAVTACQRLSGNKLKTKAEVEDHLERYFLKSELIPAIVQEAATGEVLMLAYMNRESMIKTIETGYTWFYSRSRQTLWNKGATSGHTQKVVSIAADCDDDTLLVKVVQNGPACHTGSHSCFYKEIVKN
ncbi:1-(5-phosphoribosyl)-5-[(5-phosphoribosylamino)methylideneamino]imidazole-4-carboxamide isomerase [Anaeromassilibacillus senegalensis]|uniref:Multifunctional fusion protein n=1 Tax=Anaeromassilibacillus senegalensis TaxID=1673717 RepID=A0ABS9CMG5_9FIRM|nr:1-(5-phosphoribosyl)-5-[(5-phosphoribosylamino)methylideneamino]imidazole-4-carboxamide isomerase [Anaeromassilibacillus senegalensis]